MPNILSSVLVLGAVAASLLLLPANMLFVAAVALSLSAGIAAAELRRDAGPSFRAPVTIGR
jgi:hypothetical protein